MKKKYFFLFGLIFSLIFFSCESLPEPTEDGEPVPENSVIFDAEEPPDPKMETDVSDNNSENSKDNFFDSQIENTPVSVEPTVVTFDSVDDSLTKDKAPEKKSKNNFDDNISKEVSVSEVLTPKNLEKSQNDKKIKNSTDKNSEPENKKGATSSANQSEKYTEKTWADDSVSDGIWEYEKGGVLIPIQEKSEDLVEKRNVTVSPGQKLEVKLPGTGWVFSKATGTPNIFDFVGKKIEVSDTVFTFSAKKTGSCELNFSRFDVISDSYTDFALKAVVEGDNKVEIVRWNSFGKTEEDKPPTVITNNSNPKSDSTTFSSSDKKSSSNNLSGVSEEPELQLLTADSGNSDSADKKTIQDFRGLTPNDLLSQANDTLTRGDVQKALDMLNYYVTAYSDGLDKVWYLLGQAYEKDSELKNIKKSRESYQKVVSAFPFSVWWQPSKNRIAYIDRFYFNVR